MQDQNPIPSDDLIRISYPDIHEWCARLGCTEVQLAEAIAMVGHSPARVIAYVSRQAEPPAEAEQIAADRQSRRDRPGLT